jgi:ribosomal protein S10
MKHYQIFISSKNQKSLEKFNEFFYNNLKNFIIINKYLKQKKHTKIITILKSPHVNKKAQEQFKFNIFFQTINVSTPKNFKLLTYIKNIKSNLFLDIKIKLKLLINNNLTKKTYKTILNPINFNANLFYSTKNYKNKKIKINKNFLLQKNFDKLKNLSKTNSLIKITKVLKIFDIYGELFTKN